MLLNVWYIDDEPDLCELFSEFFTSDKIKITTFTEADSALTRIPREQPDVLFIDYRLHNITGDQVALKFASAIPKYLITGDINVSSQYQFNQIFPKPYPEEEILQVLKSFVTRAS